MIELRQYTRDLSIKDRTGSMSVLDRIKSDEAIEEFIRMVPLINPTHLGIICLINAIVQLLRWVLINLPRRLFYYL